MRRTGRDQRSAFIGTTVAMADRFFTDRLAVARARRAVVPDEEHHEWLNRIIYEELVHGKVLDPHPPPRRRASSTSCGTPAPAA